MKPYGVEIAEALAEQLFTLPAHGALRAAFVALVAPALQEVRRQALNDAAAVCVVLRNPDIKKMSYQTACEDCEYDILSLQGS